MFEKGNQLIYELDSCNRLINLFKRNFYHLEDRVRKDILDEQANKFNRMLLIKNKKTRKFKDYRDHIVRIADDLFAAEFKEQAVKIKDMRDVTSNIEKTTTRYKAPNLFPVPMGQPEPHGSAVKAIGFQPSKEQIAAAPNGMMNNGVPVPDGFKHYTFCNCYAPDERHPRPTMELAQIEMLGEAEARCELYHMCEVMRK